MLRTRCVELDPAIPSKLLTSMLCETMLDASCSPELLQDRKLSASISHVAICPNMDLLAAVLDKTSIAIFRVSWERLTTIPVCAKDNQIVTAFAWSPDGANIAVATSAADLAIYSVDRSSFASMGKTKRAARDAAGPVASVELQAEVLCIEWMDISGASGNARREACYEDRAALLKKEGGDSCAEAAAGLLFLGDCEGTLLVMMHHLLFTVVCKQVMPPSCAVQGLHVTADLRNCLVIGKCSDKRNEGDPTSAEDVWALRCVDLQHMVEFLPEIERVGLEVVALRSLDKELAKVLEIVEKEWVTGAAHVPRTSVAEPLKKTLNDFAEQGSRSPWEVLHNVFCGARVNGAILQFLAGELGENGAKEALRTFRSHIDLLLGSLNSFIPFLERGLFRLSEFRALSRLTERFKPAGVLLDLTDDLFHIAESLFMGFGELSWEIEKLGNQTEALLAWLVLAAARAGGDSIRGRGSSSGNVSGEDARLVSQFFQTTLLIEEKAVGNDISEMNNVTQLYCSRVNEAVTKFETQCNLVMTKPSISISKALNVDEGLFVRVPCDRTDIKTRFSFNRSQGENGNDRQALVSLVSVEGCLISIRRSFQQASWSLGHLGLLQQNLLIHDAVMHSKNKLVLLASGSSSEGDLPSEVKSHRAYHLFLYDFAENNAQDTVHGAERVTGAVDLPNLTGMNGDVGEFVDLDKLGPDTIVSLSIDPERRIAV